MRSMLEIAVQLMQRFRLGRLETKDISVLVNTLTKLGFGPIERSRINVPRAP